MADPLLVMLMGLILLVLSLLLFWPNSGLLRHWRHTRRMTQRVLSEDALKHIYKTELRDQLSTPASVAGILQLRLNQAIDLLAELERRELLQSDGAHLRLTPAGREIALRVIRAHRLLERYLADATGFDEAEWHARAEEFEHTLTALDADVLSAQLGHPTHDPHGDPIPTGSGEMIQHGGRPMTSIALDQPARIVHISDEPEAVYAQLIAEGLTPGMRVRVTAITPERVHFWANGDEHVLAPIIAAGVAVLPCAPEPVLATRRLSELGAGEQATVADISPHCRRPERRRLMDLGIVPGTHIAAELKSPSGDPTAYRVRGALIALRKEQARLIRVSPLQEPNHERSNES